MSRSIKFRLFNSRTKEWLCGYEELGGFHLLGELVLMGGIMDFSTTDLSNIVAMQYTGINDKNGVEIYEGDIVLHSTAYKNTYIVFFENGRFIASHTNIGDSRTICPVMFGRVEVIGNIHENPELLES